MADESPGGRMSDAHKAALAQGRAEGRIVRNYLEAVRASKPRRGRKRTVASVTARLQAVEIELSTAGALEQLLLVQERIDLEKELQTMQSQNDISAIESDFIKVAAAYSERNRVGYDAWRAVGVPADVLRAAGIGRG